MKQLRRNLTHRETELINVAYDFAWRNICTHHMLSRELGITENSVGTHLHRIYRKLGIHTMVELVVYAYRAREKRRTIHLLALLLFSYLCNAQTVPPAPIITAKTGAVGSISITANAPQCHSGTACGLSDCGCWLQVWRAQCSSSTSCPALAQGDPYIQPSTLTFPTWQDNSSGGTDFVILDSDPALASGTTWQYFMTVNFSQYTPFTVSPPSNSTGPISLGTQPPPTTGTLFSVYLDFDNNSCTNKTNVDCGAGSTYSTCTCSASVYRASCSTNCPTYPGTAWTKLPLTDSTGASAVTTTVTSTNTHFTFKDDGAINGNLAYGQSYGYAVTNTWTSDPNKVEGKSSSITVATPLHMAVINYSNPSCNTTTPTCSLQVYRAQCTSTTSCPTYPSGTWKKLDMTKTLKTTVGAQGTTWKYSDTDSTLVGSTTYSWVAVNQFTSSTGISDPSAPYVATTKP